MGHFGEARSGTYLQHGVKLSHPWQNLPASQNPLTALTLVPSPASWAEAVACKPVTCTPIKATAAELTASSIVSSKALCKSSGRIRVSCVREPCPGDTLPAPVAMDGRRGPTATPRMLPPQQGVLRGHVFHPGQTAHHSHRPIQSSLLGTYTGPRWSHSSLHYGKDRNADSSCHTGQQGRLDPRKQKWVSASGPQRSLEFHKSPHNPKAQPDFQAGILSGWLCDVRAQVCLGPNNLALGA